ncbi:hypothetical protein SSX86_010086 [Deinandra increscens subsp. villosa]|uniref:Gnk2-homologous domain-containing protein n=1 Tax=Deinandra increscens subsp. villosa TaxID=3103831 RepID=A0AAP0H4M9_9ASTR
MRKHTRIPVGSSRWFAIMAVMVLVLMSEVATSQSDNTNNTLIRRYCSQFGVLNDIFFSRNLNNTISSLQRQLANGTVHQAVARTLINSETVYGLAVCRQYLSGSGCLKCLETATKEARVCGIVNGARAIYDDCEFR